MTKSLNQQINDLRKKAHKEVLRLHKKGDKPASIARVIGFTPQRVGQIINKAKEKTA